MLAVPPEFEPHEILMNSFHKAYVESAKISAATTTECAKQTLHSCLAGDRVLSFASFIDNAPFFENAPAVQVACELLANVKLVPQLVMNLLCKIVAI